MAAPTRAGGLQMVLPGYFFEMMNSVNNYENPQDGFQKYHEARENYI